jgi:hypothetical protein
MSLASGLESAGARLLATIEGCLEVVGELFGVLVEEPVAGV